MQSTEGLRRRWRHGGVLADPSFGEHRFAETLKSAECHYFSHHYFYKGIEKNNGGKNDEVRRNRKGNRQREKTVCERTVARKIVVVFDMLAPASESHRDELHGIGHDHFL